MDKDFHKFTSSNAINMAVDFKTIILYQVVLLLRHSKSANDVNYSSGKNSSFPLLLLWTSV